jgi:hypothetical protein
MTNEQFGKPTRPGQVGQPFTGSHHRDAVDTQTAQMALNRTLLRIGNVTFNFSPQIWSVKRGRGQRRQNILLP